MRRILLLAGLHSVLWGAFIILLPDPAARVWGLPKVPHDLFLWQGTGLVILLAGVGYFIAATDPERHWAVIATGLLAKILGPIGVVTAVVRGEIPADVLRLVPLNDLAWWWPLAAIVWRGCRQPGRSVDSGATPGER